MADTASKDVAPVAPAKDAAPTDAPAAKKCKICGAEATFSETAGGPFEPADFCAKHAPRPAAKRR